MKILTIAALALRRLSRDRIALFFVLLLPGLIILIVGVAIFGASGLASDRGKVGYLDQGSGALGADLISRVKKSDLIELSRYVDLESIRKDIRRETIDAAIVLPKGYTEDLIHGRSVEVQFLASTVDPAPVIRSLIQRAAGEQGAEIKAAVFANQTAGGSFEANREKAQQAAAQPAAKVAVSSQTVGKKTSEQVPAGFRYPAASNLILFVFITSLAGSSVLVEARQLGIPRRMLSTPTSARTILGGEALGRFVIAAFQGLFIFAIGGLVFNVDWGDPLGATALILVFSLVGAAVGMLAGSTLRTPEQAASIGPPIGIALGMLGGCMWPLEIVPPVMRTAGHVTPHAWAMDAFVDLIVRGETIAGIVLQLGVLGAFAAVLLPLATWRLRRTITG